MQIEIPIPKFLYKENVVDFFVRRQMVIFVTAIVTTSIISLVYYYQQNLLLAYGDAVSHLNIAKRVVSSITPGLGQLGGVWLPLQHVLMLPFIWNDFLWRSGLAGSFISMISFILSGIFIYKLIQLITNSITASWIGALVFMSNTSVIYMQSTPMGELPLIATLTGSVYFFTKWAHTENIPPLIISAFFTFCGSLIRYDAWFLFGFEVLAFVLISIKKRFVMKKTEGVIILFSTLAVLGILFWLFWNQLIFHESFYFLLSPYSAKSQQLQWLERGELPSYRNILNSLAVYTLATIKNGGYILSIISFFGVSLVIWKILKQIRHATLYMCSLLLLVPFPFYVVTLFFGISIILVPELAPASLASNLFNIRYDLMMVPAVAVFTAILFSSTKKMGSFVLLLVIISQLILFTYEKNPIVLKDALYSLSARNPGQANKYVAQNYDYGLIMFDDYSRTADAIDLNVPMQKIIYVGNHPYWDVSLEHPTKYIRWFIIRQEKGDAIWEKLQNNQEFWNNYQSVFTDGSTHVYKKNDMVAIGNKNSSR